MSAGAGLIVAGYVAIVAVHGWLGLAGAVAHVALLVAARAPHIKRRGPD